jgi:uncharacterized damage-inducible protein DinB
VIDEIRELYGYNRWANDRMLEAVARLDDESRRRDLGGSFRTLDTTLRHMLGAEWVWLRRWHGESPTRWPAHWDLSTFDALRARWRELEDEQRAFVDALTDERLSDALEYRTFDGTPFTSPLWQMLRHVVNHATYHRGQVTYILRQLGAKPASSDLIYYYRERAAS